MFDFYNLFMNKDSLNMLLKKNTNYGTEKIC